MTKCLVVGYGSIGKRHASVLEQLGCKVFLVTQQTIPHFTTYKSIAEALATHAIQYVIIANATYLHYETLIQLSQCRYQGLALVEKPLFHHTKPLPTENLATIFTGYNMRFSHIVSTLKQRMQNEELISFSARVGQYLPHWRKEMDYRNSYSAKKDQGGGVLYDLSHELDYSVWLCGRPLAVAALGGRYSNLEIDSDDVYAILMQCAQCPIVTLQLNYLDRVKRREIHVQTKKHSIYVDLIKGTLYLDGEILAEDRNHLDDTYIKQHQAILQGDFQEICHYEDGVKTMYLIDKIHHANVEKRWMTLC